MNTRSIFIIARSLAITLALAVALSAPPALAQQSPEALEFAGDWTLTIRTGQDTVEGLLTLEQREEGLLEGMFRPADDPDTPTSVSGTVTEETLTFTFDLELPPGTRGEVEFVGEREQGIMAGTFETAEGIRGEWTARRPSRPGPRR